MSQASGCTVYCSVVSKKEKEKEEKKTYKRLEMCLKPVVELLVYSVL